MGVLLENHNINNSTPLKFLIPQKKSRFSVLVYKHQLFELNIIQFEIQFLNLILGKQSKSKGIITAKLYQRYWLYLHNNADTLHSSKHFDSRDTTGKTRRVNDSLQCKTKDILHFILTAKYFDTRENTGKARRFSPRKYVAVAVLIAASW